MTSVELKVARIGNSRGVRLPAATLERYSIGETVLMEERSDGILLRRSGRVDTKLSWKETADAMAEEREDWTEWEGVASDGLGEIPWDAQRTKQVAERSAEYPKAKRRRRKP
jgi:antitoxin component of MazEF toxin-antitoxin module